MNESPLQDPEDGLTNRTLDRLVDGDLSPAEQRILFEQLEMSPEHWRRVGLAFLEAQTWKRTCQEWVPPTSSSATVGTAAPASRHHKARSLATAAALLLAFCGGMSFGKPWSIATESALPIVSRPESAPSTEPGGLPVVETVPVSFQNDEGVLSPPVATPVVEASSPVGQAWLRSTPGIPDRVREQLLRHGQKLEERQEWVEVDLADGRRGYLPVQEWTVSPVSLADFR